MRLGRVAMSAGAVAALALAGTANAATITFGPFDITQDQEVPMPTAVPGAMGTATVTLDTGSNMLSWDIEWSGLSGAPSGMHFHGAALPGQTAGVQVNIGNISGLTSPSIGGTTITALQAADLQAGLWYINIHTSLNPSGEIRGQVVPTPGAAALLGLGGLAAGRRRRR